MTRPEDKKTVKVSKEVVGYKDNAHPNVDDVPLKSEATLIIVVSDDNTEDEEVRIALLISDDGKVRHQADAEHSIPMRQLCRYFIFDMEGVCENTSKEQDYTDMMCTFLANLLTQKAKLTCEKKDGLITVTLNIAERKTVFHFTQQESERYFDLS